MSGTFKKLGMETVNDPFCRTPARLRKISNNKTSALRSLELLYSSNRPPADAAEKLTDKQLVSLGLHAQLDGRSGRGDQRPGVLYCY